MEEPKKRRIVSEETKKKLSEFNKGKKLSPEHIQKIANSNRGKKMSDESKKKISDAHKGKKLSEEHKKNLAIANKHKSIIRNALSFESKLKYIKFRLKWDVDLLWLKQFDDINKFQYINYMISIERNHRGFTNEIYIQFIEKFYYDKKFNKLYNKWIETGDRWIKPSLDHIIPISKLELYPIDILENLQFISWLENWMKSDIDQNKWNEIKLNIQKYF